MTVAFDRRAGGVSGQPQRVTTGPAVPGFRVSADGRWIAYRYWTDSQGMVLKVVPATGGQERTVYVADGRIDLMDWSADGRHIYFYRGPGQTFRVAVEGGEPPEETRRAPTGPSAPRVPYQIVRVSDRSAEGLPFQVQRYDGSPIAGIALPQGAASLEAGTMFALRAGRTFAANGRQLLTVASGTITALRVVSVTGGERRQLGEARADEWPLGWSSDGRSVLFATPREGHLVIMSTPVWGGAARELGPLPDRGPPTGNQWASPITFSADGRYLAYSRPTPGHTDRTFIIRSADGADEWIVTRSLYRHSAFSLAGPGGTPNIAGADFLYFERRDDQVELHATPPTGPPRLIRAFLEASGTAPTTGVFGNRVAFARSVHEMQGGVSAGRGTSIIVSDGPGGPERVVATVPDALAFDDVVWSPDGRWIAASAYVGTSPRDYAIKVLVVGVTPDGDVFSPARLIDTPIIYAAWGLQWLPDASAVTLTGQSPPDGRYDVWLVPLGNEGRPTALTSGEQDAIGYNALSPDGRHVVYRAHIVRGSSLWLADLGDALERLGRK